MNLERRHIFALSEMEADALIAAELLHALEEGRPGNEDLFNARINEERYGEEGPIFMGEDEEVGLAFTGWEWREYLPYMQELAAKAPSAAGDCLRGALDRLQQEFSEIFQYQPDRTSVTLTLDADEMKTLALAGEYMAHNREMPDAPNVCLEARKLSNGGAIEVERWQIEMLLEYMREMAQDWSAKADRNWARDEDINAQMRVNSKGFTALADLIESKTGIHVEQRSVLQR